MPLYLCLRWRGEPMCRDGQELAWVALAEIEKYAMTPADKPLVSALRDRL